MQIFGKTVNSYGVIALLFVIALAVLNLLTAPAHSEETAQAGSFYQWTDINGDFAASDSLKSVPASYRESARLRTFAEVREATQAQVTPMSEPAFVRIPTLRPFAGVDPMPLLAPTHTGREECDQPIRVESRRVQQGSYNRTLYFVTNGCGEVVSVTPQTPWVDVSVD